MQAQKEGASRRTLSLFLSLSHLLLLLLPFRECISHRQILSGSLVVNQSRALPGISPGRVRELLLSMWDGSMPSPAIHSLPQ
jgi:hypothetical protein